MIRSHTPSTSRRRRGSSRALFASVGCALLLVAFTFSHARPSMARQSLPEPRREQLLNGLKVFLLPRPSDALVVLKLRVRSGAAFDLAGKEGLMALLGDALFADESVHEYVKEDLGGRLEVFTDHDRIDVTLTGRASEFERMVELLRNAFVSTRLTPEAVTRLREARVKAVRDLAAAPGSVADRAAAARLYGAHPYGRAADGTPESLARVERADLLFVSERYLTPNNATLVVTGPIETARAMRALRQYLGAWRRSDVEVPATFRLPSPPDARALVVNREGAPDAEVRLLARGLSRSDRDAPAARLLALVAHARWLKNFPELKGRPFFVEHRARGVGGVFAFGASVPHASAARALQAARASLASLHSAPATPAEFEAARREVVAAAGARPQQEAETQADLWLDLEAYRVNAADEARALASVTPAEMQRVATRLFLGAPLASVVVGDAAQVSAELARSGEIEVVSEATAAAAATNNAPPRPASGTKPFSVPVRRP